MKARILVVDDEESIRYTFESFLQDEGHSVVAASGYGEAVERIVEADFDLIFADIIMEHGSGIDLLREMRRRNLNSPVVMITGNPNIDTASEAVRLGAFDYLIKPVRQESLLRVTRVALEHKALADKEERYRRNLEAIFRSVKDSIITVDKNLAVVEINDAALKRCRLSRDVLGHDFRSLPKRCNGRCVEVLEEAIDNRDGRNDDHGRGEPAAGSRDRESWSIPGRSGQAGGNKAKAARLLQISRRSFYRELEKYLIEDEEEIDEGTSFGYIELQI